MGAASKLSRDLANVRMQLKTKKTRGTNERDLDPEEITALEEKRDAIQAEMRRQATERNINKINSHTTAESDRVIQSVQDATRNSEEFFQAVGGSGSSTDLRTRAKVLMTRATEKAKEERAQERSKAKQKKKCRKGCCSPG